MCHGDIVVGLSEARLDRFDMEAFITIAVRWDKQSEWQRLMSGGRPFDAVIVADLMRRGRQLHHSTVKDKPSSTWGESQISDTYKDIGLTIIGFMENGKWKMVVYY